MIELTLLHMLPHSLDKSTDWRNECVGSELFNA
jgi:hypothetical protein